ncbi:MAG: methylmalonyl Co-A mutase-associated GTPase MeaB [Candidatus Cloacimonetes bacterium]|nr:methylmalonyl Co-A mutase-associated GTPase MeaB [Candidatus Cloacimonadota bacterium]
MLAQELALGILSQNRRSLARAITLVESSLPKHRQAATELIRILKSQASPRETLRIGVSGVPGVGKSTFLETVGLAMANANHKVCVLAVDPSSQISGGSILGDKTRMQKLSLHPNGFVRPSPARDTLGGTALRSREVISLCEAFGFDRIFVETVGVGQSETTVYSMVDVFLVLLLPNAGDDLQGIKKGIMELADFIFVNKSDLDPHACNRMAKYCESVYELIHTPREGWKPRVMTGSSLSSEGVDELLRGLMQFEQFLLQNSYKETVRRTQKQDAFLQELKIVAWDQFLKTKNNVINKASSSLIEDKISVADALWQVIEGE